METPFRFPQPERDQHDEELEVTPWDSLVRPPQSSASRWIVLAAIGLAVMAIAISAARTYWPSARPPEAAVGMAGGREDVDGVVGAPAVPSVPTTVGVAPPVTPVVVSEADLMAIDPAEIDRSAAELAELVVADLFTLDGESSIDDPWVGEAIDTGGVRSYVESVNAVEVIRTAGDGRQVTVVVRTLVATGENGYRRQPLRALQIDVGLDADGLGVIDLPRPVALPQMRIDPEELTPTSRFDLVERARELAAPYGVPASEAYHVGATADGRVRVAILVRDEEGVDWPVAFWFDSSGAPRP